MGRLRQPTLDADGLVVRPWQLHDAAAVFQAYQDPAIQRWHVRRMTDLAEASFWISSWPNRWSEETGADWAVTTASTVIGRVGIKRLDLWEGVAEELAYWVIPAARGRNTAARAVAAVSNWSFTVLGLHRLELLHATDNEASCRVADKAGFRPEGTCANKANTPTAGTTCTSTHSLTADQDWRPAPMDEPQLAQRPPTSAMVASSVGSRCPVTDRPPVRGDAPLDDRLPVTVGRLTPRRNVSYLGGGRRPAGPGPHMWLPARQPRQRGMRHYGRHASISGV